MALVVSKNIKVKFGGTDCEIIRLCKMFKRIELTYNMHIDNKYQYNVMKYVPLAVSKD